MKQRTEAKMDWAWIPIFVVSEKTCKLESVSVVSQGCKKMNGSGNQQSPEEGAISLAASFRYNSATKEAASDY
jgi:hypothetical protein